MGFLVGFIIFFLAIGLTIILGAVSKAGDRRVELEGRVTPEQRLPTEPEDRSFHPGNPIHQAYHYA